MSVREVMEFLAQCDPEAIVTPCDWDDEVALRVFHDGGCRQLRWSVEEEE